MSDYIPDPIELGEARAERLYDKMHKGNDQFECSCGKLFHIDTGGFPSPDPYSPPVCPDCFDEVMKSWEKRNK